MSEIELDEIQVKNSPTIVTDETVKQQDVASESVIEETEGNGEFELEQRTEEDKDEQKFEEAEVVKIGAGRYVEGIGRRKTSTARVRIWDNPDKEVMAIMVNNRKYTEYFPSLDLQKSADAPLRKLRVIQGYKVTVQTKGGGLRGQADAIKLGLARALVKLNPDWRVRLKKAGLLQRDPRKVERKKYGLKKARRAPQWSKR